MNFYNLAREIQEETVKNRREIHKRAETGLNTSNTAKYIKEKLIEYGYEVEEIIENGLVVTAGCGDPVLAIRADMDALPMKEESEEEFASTNGCAHTCGHDIHSAMALSAAKLIKENEDKLNHRVKIYFQPAEETLEGSKKMIENGILENPKVDAAVMIHCDSLKEKALYIKSGGAMTTASNNFRIKIKGKGAHGAMPENGIDPVYIGAHLVIAISEITAREIAFPKGAVITTGYLSGGSAPNIIADEAIIEGTFRSYNMETMKYIEKRLVEIAKGVAETFRGKAEVEFLSSAPVVENSEDIAEKVKSYLEKYKKDFDVIETEAVTATEDFAFIAQEVPVLMMMLGTKKEHKDGNVYPLHHPKVVFDEDAMAIGVAALSEIAFSFGK